MKRRIQMWVDIDFHTVLKDFKPDIKSKTKKTKELVEILEEIVYGIRKEK